jgi:hypothetical protein
MAALDTCFPEDEVWAVIRALPLDKAPGPDRFTWRFYQVGWPVIKRDIIRTLAAWWS